MPSGLVALGHHQVDALLHVSLGVLRLARQCGDQHALLVTALDHLLERIHVLLDDVGELKREPAPNC